MFDLSGKNIVITGATGGIGKAICTALHKQGANLLITGTNHERLTSFASTFSERISVQQCNLSSQEDVSALIPKAVEVLGRVDALICNAGITKDGLAMRMSDDDFSEVIKINLESTFSLNRDAVKHMIKTKTAGRIVNISSVVAFSGNIGQANYAASKAGMVAMSKSIAKETASRGITINCVAPGFIETAMTDKIPENYKSKILETIPAGKMGEPKDVASAVLYLVADESKYFTGQTLHVNGGMLMV